MTLWAEAPVPAGRAARPGLAQLVAGWSLGYSSPHTRATSTADLRR